MKPREFMKGCEHDGSYITVGEVEKLMIEYSRLMCKKQKEICDVAFDEYIWSLNRDPYCVIKAPYPEELL